MDHRTGTLKLPPDLVANRYAAIAHAVLSAFDPEGLAGVALVVADELATDDELNRALDTYSEHNPRGG
ncbi:hypothetical protein AB0H12_27825 [Actinosynnema sp. NPDC023794]